MPCDIQLLLPLGITNFFGLSDIRLRNDIQTNCRSRRYAVKRRAGTKYDMPCARTADQGRNGVPSTEATDHMFSSFFLLTCSRHPARAPVKGIELRMPARASKLHFNFGPAGQAGRGGPAGRQEFAGAIESGS